MLIVVFTLRVPSPKLPSDYYDTYTKVHPQMCLNGIIGQFHHRQVESNTDSTN